MNKYRSFFDIDPDFWAQVNKDVIEKHPELWKKYYPHQTFVKLIKDTINVLSRNQKLSLWVEGAYGTGKSHAVLTMKHLLDASLQDTEEYFKKYNINEDLQKQFISIKNSGKILTVHRYGSSYIDGDNDLILAIQESIQEALDSAGISNDGNETLKEAIISWLSDDINKNFFNELISTTYSSEFSGDTVDTLITKLKVYHDIPLKELMRNITKVAKQRGIKTFTLSIEGLCNWIKEVIDKNDLRIVFIWDEFTEFFTNNIRSLTGFQQIAEISATYPFYLMIVTHKSSGLFKDSDKDKSKILDRFVKPTCIIELPENIAFQLMGAAMEKTKDKSLLNDWKDTIEDLYERTGNSRKIVKDNAKITDEELKNILPIHPYAALLLKHISSAFNSNQRSMFDFIKNDRGEDIKGFQWFIDNFGPEDINPFLSIDMLWDFFYEMGKDYLSHEIRQILDCFPQTRNLDSDESRVFKAVLLLQAISLKVGNSVELFIPNDKNIANAFEGTDLENDAEHCLKKLVRDKLLFEKPIGQNKTQYSVLMTGVDSGVLDNLIKQVSQKTTSDLVEEGLLKDSLELIKQSNKLRYHFEYCGYNDFDRTIKKLRSQESQYKDKICAVVIFAKDDDESVLIDKAIKTAIKDSSFNMIYIDTSVTPLGKDGCDQYYDNKAKALYHNGKDSSLVKTYETYASQVLRGWRDRISQGQFLVTTDIDNIEIRVSNLSELNNLLCEINHQKYKSCLECEYEVADSMYSASSLKMAVECAVKQETAGIFKSANQLTRLEHALEGAWKEENYWDRKPSLLISKIKKTVESIIQCKFENEGRVSIRDIYSVLKTEPYGFMPCNMSAFIMGFVLKEYVSELYSWSDDLTNDSLDISKLKEMISEVIFLDITPNLRYKDKYIVTMTPEEKTFNEKTAEIFDIPIKQCNSIEQTRERVRAKMKELSFPIWSLKKLLERNMFRTDSSVLSKLVDYYSGIANNNNLGVKKTDSDIAISIGKEFLQNQTAVSDLKELITKENCTKGMELYLGSYNNGVLLSLSEEIEDMGQYITILRNKFDSDAANWVWNEQTANQKIDEVILEYKIVVESNKYLEKNKNYKTTIQNWIDVCDNIRIPFPVSKDKIGDLSGFMSLLYEMKRMGQLIDSKKTDFYSYLLSSGSTFKSFYENQISLFIDVCSFYLDGLSLDEKKDVFKSIPSGIFIKETHEYMTLVRQKVEDFKSSLGYVKLRKIWQDKTNTDSPREWSRKNKMPILLLIDNNSFMEAKFAFSVINSKHSDASSIDNSIKFIEHATFFDLLFNEIELDNQFKRKMLRQFATVIDDVNEIKDYLYKHISVDPYEWYGHPEVEDKVKKFAEAKYNERGCEKAINLIDSMEPSETKRYLKELIKDNINVGIEILNSK